MYAVGGRRGAASALTGITAAVDCVVRGCCVIVGRRWVDMIYLTMAAAKVGLPLVRNLDVGVQQPKRAVTVCTDFGVAPSDGGRRLV
jgi:hypothetical protein